MNKETIACRLTVFFCGCLVFPVYGQGRPPSEALINNLINQCFDDRNSHFANYEIKAGSLKNRDVFNSETRNFADDDDKANGTTFVHDYLVGYSYRHLKPILIEEQVQPWQSDIQTDFHVFIKNGVLNFDGGGCHYRVDMEK